MVLEQGPTRSHWCNAVVGTIDLAYNLTQAELGQALTIVNTLLTTLRIPQRGAPEALPMVLAAEMLSAASGRSTPHKSARAICPGQIALIVEPHIWAELLSSWVLAAYPSITVAEHQILKERARELFIALESTERPAAVVPVELLSRL